LPAVWGATADLSREIDRLALQPGVVVRAVVDSRGHFAEVGPPGIQTRMNDPGIWSLPAGREVDENRKIPEGSEQFAGVGGPEKITQ